MKYAMILVALLSLSGCWESRSNAQTQSIETRQGVEAGQPVNVVIRRQELAQTEATAGVDVQAAISAAMNTLRGDVIGALDKLKAQSLDGMNAKLEAMDAKGGAAFPTTELATGAAGAVAALMALLKHREAAAAKKDADEAWDKHTKAVAKLPPEEAEKVL